MGGGYAGLLSKVSHSERDEGPPGSPDEEWQARDERLLPGVRHEDVPYRQGLTRPTPHARPARPGGQQWPPGLH